MKRAAFIYVLGSLAPGLSRVRRRTWIMIGLGVLALVAILAWAAITMLSWLWGQIPAMAESGRQAAGAAMEKVEQVAPGLKTQLGPLLDEAGLPGPESAGQQPPGDVSGNDLPGLTRYSGLLMTYYAREAGRTELRYAGQGDFRTVLGHYASQFAAAGYAQEDLSATPEAERHRFVKAGDTLDFEIRKAGADGKVEVILVDNVQ